MNVIKDEKQHCVNGTGTVLPVPLSHLASCVGVHWLRISLSTKHLATVAEFSSHVWGDFDQDGYGLWSYDTRLYWSSGVSLNYDEDHERSNHVHNGQMTLDCPGSSLDGVTAPDLQLMIEYFEALGGKCTRLDVFFDDYKWVVKPIEIYEASKRGDYSGFKIVSRRERRRLDGTICHDEVAFGRRGSFGSGAYLRIYDKCLESKGDFDCCRWEVEFSQGKADSVFKKLAQTCGNINAFATLCGSLVAGCITFVHRNGDPNISRLERYKWWEEIGSILGGVISVRIERKKDTLTGKIDWVKRNVSPSLACLRKVFINDKAFFRWLFDVCHEGESRMNPFSEQIARENEHTLNYQWGEFIGEDFIYDKAVSQL